ncbi:hypothetical protein GMAR_ORF253 [Golden Marseillevirus]|uniref:hypothetical protein n=1 Tax=Golden Marseillevirus TaxID=1720526 RepID=UPI000877AAC5|nr:hypothetical protein GMAR_ORF253 [Golden Marseillevirus]ALX27627.1 hypothetical protein GMAR_ORF253 [Golden Marseillevirus]
MQRLVNPETGRNILVGGKTHNSLIQRGILPIAKPVKKGQGGSNVKKYKKEHLKPKDFCGTVPGSFPVNTEKRAKAALSYARNDPNPERVKKCARQKAKEMHWF